MANHKTGKNVPCANCGTSFYLIRYRLLLNVKNHFCGTTCRDMFWGPIRSKMFRTREYPVNLGPCQRCGEAIIAKDAGMVKPDRKYCSRSCRAAENNALRIWKPESRAKLSVKAKARPGYKHTPEQRLAKADRLRGDKSHFWKGGKTEETMILRGSANYGIWREAVFARDNWTCVLCGARSAKGNPVQLAADHIKPWSQYPELRFAIDNGRTLCRPCHLKTDTFGYKATAMYRKEVNQ